jgi:hypothetical protein
VRSRWYCTNAQRTSQPTTNQPTNLPTSHQGHQPPAKVDTSAHGVTELCGRVSRSTRQLDCPVHSEIRDSRLNNRTTSAVGSLVVSLRYHWYSLQCTSIPTHPPDKRQARVSRSPLAGNLATTRNEQARADDIRTAQSGTAGSLGHGPDASSVIFLNIWTQWTNDSNVRSTSWCSIEYPSHSTTSATPGSVA